VAVNDIHIYASPEDVIAFLADGKRYADWVVGAKRIRSVEPDWPAQGSKFHHTVGVGPVNINDSTVVRSVDPPNRLVLEARARPLGRAMVKLEVVPEDEGSLVRMTEEPINVPGFVKRLLDPPIFARNAEALRRLKDHVAPSD